MDNKSKLIFSFAAGALVGAGIAALMTTDKGKKILEEAKNQMNEFGGEISENFSKLENEILETFGSILKKQNPKT